MVARSRTGIRFRASLRRTGLTAGSAKGEVKRGSRRTRQRYRRQQHRGTHSFSAFVHGKSPAFYFAATYSILRATSLSPDCSVRTTNVTISLYRSKHLPQRTRIHPALLRCREPRLFDVSPPPSRALTTDGPGLAPHNTGAIRGQ